MRAIVMTEEFWANSMLSIARYYGKIIVEGHQYFIVDKRGRTLLECSIEAEREGREKAIGSGEPADLCRSDFVPIYRKLGRDAFLKLLEEHPEIDSVKKAKEILKAKKQEI